MFILYFLAVEVIFGIYSSTFTVLTNKSDRLLSKNQIAMNKRQARKLVRQGSEEE